MTAQEFKKKIYDTVEPLLDGQGQIHFKVHEYMVSFMLSADWYDANDQLLAMIDISQMREVDDLFHYCIRQTCYPSDQYDRRMSDIISAYCTYENGLFGHFFEDWTGVEKTLQTFTEYLVKEFN